MPKVTHPPKQAELTITLPKTLDGRPMSHERAKAIAKHLVGKGGEVYIDERGRPTVAPEQLLAWARAAERAAERARW